jgi:hypothetical protein
MKEIFVAPGPNPMEDLENEEGKIAGFWQGLWHGSIVPITFLISLFKEDVGVYESHNNGAQRGVRKTIPRKQSFKQTESRDAPIICSG